MQDLPAEQLQYMIMHVFQCEQLYTYAPCRLFTWKTSLPGSPSMRCPPPPCQSQCKLPSKHEILPRCSPTRHRPLTLFWLAEMWWCPHPQPVASPCATTFLSWRLWCRIGERVLFTCSQPRYPHASHLQTTRLQSLH